MMNSKLIRRFQEVNRELWLILSLFAIAWLLNSLVALHRMVLGFYMLPTLFSAYYYGKRHATLTALASVCLVTIVAYFNPALFGLSSGISMADNKWFDITVWGATLVVTGYAMGALYDRKEAHVRELKQTYDGVLMILQQFIAKDKHTQNHSYRVSIYAMRIGSSLGLSPERLEDIRAAALLHDIGKIEISRELLYKAASLTQEEYEQMQTHVNKGADILEPVGGTLHRVIPIILAHHDKFNGCGYHPTRGDEIPLEARIISVADVYDALTSDRPYRKAMPPLEAREVIVKGAGTDFDPDVVAAFQAAFSGGLMEVPELVI
ncbi:MAG TPA: HD-GYP domain-containing protein [Methylomirabilota bacterium]|jgi:putative nucleotidyltransferase with HDIG domain|nr:HD-GYP domain-containing protein [Methylomirabilota bacterium]